MGKRTALTSIARPRSTEATGGTAGRVDVLAKAMDEASGVGDEKPKKKRQKSREDMVSTNLWMSPEAKKQLKIHTMTQDEGLEEYIRNAVNARLEKEGQEFRIA
ncbi:MAG: hypothetical protein AAFV59_04580 [Pseudomonadota bacterium]